MIARIFTAVAIIVTLIILAQLWYVLVAVTVILAAYTLSTTYHTVKEVINEPEAY